MASDSTAIRQKITAKSMEDLYDANKFNGNLLEQFTIKRVTAIHRKRRVQVPKKLELLLRVAPSVIVTTTFDDQPTNGVMAAQSMQKFSMIKLNDMGVRQTINDGGIDLQFLKSDEAQNSSRGFINCWRQTMERYHDLVRAQTCWNVTEGFATDEQPSADSCILLTSANIKAGDELSICYGVYFWLHEVVQLLTNRNLYGFWCVLTSHIQRDKFLGEWEDKMIQVRVLAEATGLMLGIVRYHALNPSAPEGTTVPYAVDKLQSTLAALDEYDEQLKNDTLQSSAQQVIQFIGSVRARNGLPPV